MSACKHYADLYGRCVDCGKTWAERGVESEPRSISEVIGTVPTADVLGHLVDGPPPRPESAVQDHADGSQA